MSEDILRLTRVGDVFTPTPEDTLPWPASIVKMRYHPGTGSIIAMDELADLLVAFTPRGEFLRRFGRQGAGPGEISGLEDFALGAGGVVAVLDNQNGRLSLFGQDGEFRGSFSVPIYFGMDFLPDGRMVLFPSRHDGALDVYTRDGSRSSIGRAEDLPYVCTDRLEPGPDCRSKIPCMLCNVAVLAPDRIALVDQFQARVLLLDSDGGVRRTLDLGRVQPMRTWLAEERERLQRYWDEGKVAHSRLILDAMKLSEHHLALIVSPPRPARNGNRVWVLDIESGEILHFAWDGDRVGGTVAVGESEIYTVDYEDYAVVRYGCAVRRGAVVESAGSRTLSARQCLMQLAGVRPDE